MTIDNLKPNASAAEMEAAIKATLAMTDSPKEAIEEKTEEKAEEKNNDGQPESADSAAPLEVTEDNAVDDEIKKKAKSYDDLRPWVTRLSQEVAEFKKQKTQAPQMDQPVTAKPQPTYEQWQEAYERDPLGTAQILADRVADSKVKGLQERVDFLTQTLGGLINKSDVDSFRVDKTNYPDFVEVEDDIKEVLGHFPEEVVGNPKYNKALLKIGYEAVQGRKAKEAAIKAYEAGQQKILAKKQAKAEAHVEGSGKSSSDQPLNPSNMNSKELFDLMKAKGLA